MIIITNFSDRFADVAIPHRFTINKIVNYTKCYAAYIEKKVQVHKY